MYKKQKWNVTTLIRLGSNFLFFAAFYFARLELLACLQARACLGGNKGGNFKEGENKWNAKKEKLFPQTNVFRIFLLTQI